MSTTVNGTTGVTFPDGTNQNTSASGFGFKNRIINGACMIDQRNGGASVTTGFAVDRFQTYQSTASKFTFQQNAGSVIPPAGFSNYWGATVTSAYSVGASDIFEMYQAIEGNNVADLNWGGANAKTVTLSFWVRSSLTGTFGGAICNSALNRSYPYSYTISSANTWEQKTITIPGDTTGTWLTNNGVGMFVILSLGAGSTLSGTAGSWAGANYNSATGATSVVGTNGATFYITGVQLEKGSTATSFDYRPYGTELALCQRYYFKTRYDRLASASYSASGISWPIISPVPMRTDPSFSGTVSQILSYSGSVVNRSTISYSVGYSYGNVIGLNTGGLSSMADNTMYWCSIDGGASFSAEL